MNTRVLWANSLYGELVLTLLRERPALLAA